MRALADRLEFDSLPWLNYARCLVEQIHPDVFFGESAKDVAAAKAVCSHCPAVNACRDYAVKANIQHGVWGNTTVRERRAIRRRMRDEAAA